MASVAPIACAGLALLFYCQQRQLIVQYEDQIAKLVSDNQINAQSIDHLEGRINQLEHDLKISQEKNRACQQENKNLQKTIEQLNAELASARSSHSMESSRMQQNINDLCNEVDSTKSELTNSRSEMEASKLKLAELMFSLEMEQRSRFEAEEERNRLKQEIQSRDTQLDHMSQQLIVAEGELEETSDNVKRLRNGLDSYQQKYEACVNQISSLEADLTRQHEKLNLSHKQGLKLEDAARRLQSDFKAYRVEHCHPNNEFLEKDGMINHMEFNSEQLRADLHIKTRQVGDLTNNIIELKMELVTLRKQNDSVEKDIHLLREYFPQSQC